MYQCIKKLYLTVTAQYKENMFTNFPLYIIAGDNVNLLCRNWLSVSEVNIDWAILFNCCKGKLNNISKTNYTIKKVKNFVKNYLEKDSNIF